MSVLGHYGYAAARYFRCVALALAVSIPATAAIAQSGAFDTVTIALHLDLDTLDPTQNINAHQKSVYAHLFDPLLTHDKAGNVTPALAERWERVDDTRWRFYLRKDVTFQNGEPFNAEAVKFTVERMQDKASQASSFMSEFAAIEIVDEYTIDLVTKGPYSGTLALVTDYINPVPPKYYTEVGAEGFASKPIGTGAYSLESWSRGDRIVLKPNPDWKLGKQNADKIVFWIVPQASTRIAALINGEADIIAAVPPLQAEQVEKSGVARIEAAPGSTYPIWGGLINDRPTLDDARVRRAINYAVNKEAIVDRLLRGYGRAMGQPCPAERSCWNSDVKPYAYDPEKAKALLAEARVSDLKVKLHFPSGVVPQGPLLAQAVAADLQRVGITAEIVQDEWSVFAGKLFDFQTKQSKLGDVFLMYFGGGATLERIVATILVSDRNWNWEHYDNPKVDELFRISETAIDEEARNKALMEMAQIVHDDAPWLFLYEPFSLWGVNNKIEWKARRIDDMMLVREMKPAAN